MEYQDKPLKFGKHKGKTLTQLAGTDEGKGYLRWLRDQEANDPKYIEMNQARSEYISEVLKLYEGYEKQQTGKKNFKEVQVGQATPATNNMSILKLLDEMLDVMKDIRANTTPQKEQTTGWDD